MKDKQKEYWDTTVQDSLVEEVLQYKSHGTALDLGAGTGRDSIFLAEHGFIVTTVDNDKTHHDNLAQKISVKSLPIDQVIADIQNYVPNTDFDVVISDMVLHFLDRSGVESAIKNMQAWTKPNGINIVIAYSDKNPTGKRPYLFRHNQLKEQALLLYRIKTR